MVFIGELVKIYDFILKGLQYVNKIITTNKNILE